MNESQIKHENGDIWVGDNRNSYTVYVAGLTHSIPDSSYAHDTDGLSIAIARCDYLARSPAAYSKHRVQAWHAAADAHHGEALARLDDDGAPAGRMPA